MLPESQSELGSSPIRDSSVKRESTTRAYDPREQTPIRHGQEPRGGRTPSRKTDLANGEPFRTSRLRERVNPSARDHAFCVWAKHLVLTGLDNPHRSGDGLCDPHPAADRRILKRAEQPRSRPTRLDKVRAHLIDFHPCPLITNNKPKRVRSRWCVFSPLPQLVALLLSLFVQMVAAMTMITRRRTQNRQTPFLISIVRRRPLATLALKD